MYYNSCKCYQCSGNLTNIPCLHRYVSEIKPLNRKIEKPFYLKFDVNVNSKKYKAAFRK